MSTLSPPNLLYCSCKRRKNPIMEPLFCPKRESFKQINYSKFTLTCHKVNNVHNNYLTSLSLNLYSMHQLSAAFTSLGTGSEYTTDVKARWKNAKYIYGMTGVITCISSTLIWIQKRGICWNITVCLLSFSFHSKLSSILGH